MLLVALTGFVIVFWVYPQGQAAEDTTVQIPDQYYQTCSTDYDCRGYCESQSCATAYCSGSADPVPGYCTCKSQCQFDVLP